MDDLSVDLILQMSDDELAEVMEEYSGYEFSEAQIPAVRNLIKISGSLDGVLDLLDDLDSAAEAA